VARRLPRRATAAVAAGLAVVCVALTAGPAVADQIRGAEWWLSALHVTTAWESSKGSGVTVAVLGTGVDATQPDLVGSVTTGPDFTGSGRAPGSPFWGINGTAVASLIAGHGHGAQDTDGIVGVAPSARILSVRVTLEANDPHLNASVASALPTAIANGIRYAVGHGAQVIDLPLDPAPFAGLSQGGSAAERAAVAYALSKNVVLVAPAGDGGAGSDAVNYPAAYTGVISVGAFNQSFTKAPFTSHQPYVTLTAAGNGVAAATPTGYLTLHSTSAASAVVAGIAALIRAQFPTLDPAQVTSALTQSTVFRPPGGQKDGSGFGTADAQAALLEAARINAAVPTHSSSRAAVVAPSSPPVHVRSLGIWGTLRYAAFGLAALLLLALFGVILNGRARRRRARAARLAPLRDVRRVPVRAQPNFSAVPPASGAQFGTAQFGATPPGGNAFADTAFGQARFEEPQSGPAPFPGAQYTDTPFPGDEHTDAPFPGGPAAKPPFPGGPVAQTSSPGDPMTLAPFPGDEPAPFPGDGAVPFPEDPFGDSPFPGAQTAGTGPFPAVTSPLPAVPPVNGSPHRGAPRPVPPTPRSHVVRPPRISGSPPWEPAQKPAGELPWAVGPPAKSSVTRSAPPRRAIPADAQPWGPAARSTGPLDDPDLAGTGLDSPGAESMFPDSVDLGGRVPGSMPLPAPQADRGEPADKGSDDEDGSKLYVWKPAEMTEAFPTVPPGDADRK
jgi:Subtilase family